MPLIHVESRGLDTQSAQESHASHTQEDFLHDACAAVPSVDAHGEIPIQLLIFRKIGIHQVERNTSDIDSPNLESDLAGSNLNHARQRLSLRIQDRLHGKVFRIQHGVVFGLPVFIIDRLHEVALTIK